MTRIGVLKGWAAVAVGSGVAVAVTVAVGAGVRVGVGLLMTTGMGIEGEVTVGAGVGSDVGVAGDAGATVEVTVGVFVRFRNSDRGCSRPSSESAHATKTARDRKTKTARTIRKLHPRRSCPT